MLELMNKKGIEPGLVTWNILISSFNHLGKHDLAIKMMKKMEDYGILLISLLGLL